MSREHDRFKDAPWFNREQKTVMVGGAGGISSWLSLLLVRAGFDVMIFDYDTIEEHNLGGQLYQRDQIEMKKVFALKNTINQFSSGLVIAIDQKIELGMNSMDFVLCGFDNMKARKDMFLNWKKDLPKYKSPPIFIDGRLEAEMLQIFCVTPDNMDLYESEQLFEDSEVEPAPCTFKQTSHAAAMIGAHMTGFLTNHVTNINEGEKVRDVPYFYEYFIPLNLTT